MNKVYHRNKTPYGDTTAILLEDATGYVMITMFNSHSKVAVIHDLVILRERRGEGLGSELLEEAVVEAGRMGANTCCLSVEPGSWQEEWYRRHGFEEAGEVGDLGHKFNVLERSL